MVKYDNSVSTVLACLKEKGFSERTIKIYKKLYRAVREYLVKTSQIYTPELGNLLLEQKDDEAFQFKGDNQRAACITKINAVYQYGEVTNVLFVPRKPYAFDVLGEQLSDELTGFLEYSKESLSNETIVNYRCNCAAFLKFAQARGRTTITEITYEDIRLYHDSLAYLSEVSRVSKESCLHEMLFFHHKNGNADPGKWLFLFLIEHGRFVFFEDLPTEAQELIKSLRAKSLSYPAEKFLATGRELVSRIREEGYAEDYVEALEKAILYLHVFLDAYNLGYDPEIADAWISCDAIGTVFRGKSSLDSAKRMVNLFRDYAVSGECHLNYVYRNKPSQIDTLPSWCIPAVESFIEQRKLEKLEKNTIASDASALFRFCSFIVNNGATSYEDVTGELVAAFNINDVHTSQGGKNAYNCKIRRFLKYLAREGLVNNPSIYLLLGSAAAPYESIVTTLTPEEIETARLYVDNASTPTEIRDSAMFMLGADMGLRGVDIAGLRVSDVDLIRSCLKVRQAKTNKDVELSIPTDVGNIIFRYLRDVRPKPCKTDFLFVGIYRPHQRIRRGVCYDALHRILPDRNVSGSGFHVTRKTFATNRLQNGADPMDITDCMGQSHTRSLIPYLALDAGHMSMCPISLETLRIPMKRSLLC